MAATLIQPTFNPGAVGATGNYNFVSTFELMKRDVDSELHKIYYDQVFKLMELIGDTETLDIGSFFHEHYEENPLMPKILASNSVGTAGASVTFTLANYTSISDETLSVPNVAPFIGTSGVTAVPVRVNDFIKVGDVLAIVTAVNSGAGTFAATPNDSGQTIPASTNREIMIFSNTFGDGTDQNTPLINPYNKVTSWLQNVKNTIEYNDTMAGLKMYTADGKEYMLRGEANALLQQMNFIDGGLLLSKPLANTALSGGSTPRVNTRGLIHQAKDGYNQGYNAALNYTIDDIKNLSLNMEIRKSGNAFMILEGAQLSAAMDSGFKSDLNAGAISYGSFSGNEEKFISYKFGNFVFGLTSFHRKRLSWMSDPQAGGAEGQNYSKEGIVIPMDMTKDAKTNKAMRRVTKLTMKGLDLVVIDRDLRRIGDTGTAKVQVTYDGWAGMKCVGTSQFGYISPL